MMLDIGKWLKAERKKAGLLQRDVAKKAGISQNLISRYETGEVIPSVYAFEALCMALGATCTIGGDTKGGECG